MLIENSIAYGIPQSFLLWRDSIFVTVLYLKQLLNMHVLFVQALCFIVFLLNYLLWSCKYNFYSSHVYFILKTHRFICVIVSKDL
jgi:hypothetical protein